MAVHVFVGTMFFWGHQELLLRVSGLHAKSRCDYVVQREVSPSLLLFDGINGHNKKGDKLAH